MYHYFATNHLTHINQLKKFIIKKKLKKIVVESVIVNDKVRVIKRLTQTKDNEVDFINLFLSIAVGTVVLNKVLDKINEENKDKREGENENNKKNS